jgi:tRNA-2-methylthio-N6-dimethylallyladenosine synthase
MSKKFYLETYGCQMNVSDSEVVASILAGSGYEYTDDIKQAGLILINTCSIRENAEQRIWGRLKAISHLKKSNSGIIIGLIGCMAERLKKKIIDRENLIDLVAGPDAYRDLPSLIAEAENGYKPVNVLLSPVETYSDINPVRLDKNGITAYVSIMRGCNNMCTYCVVPYVRGAERSRDPDSILKEVEDLWFKGYKEVTLLGQNVDSYSFKSGKNTISFPDLLEKVALVNPLLRIRFSTSHPKDLSDDLLFKMSQYNNICKHIHLPVQSGSNRILKLMHREYTREWYLDRIKAIRLIVPDCAVSTDIITGFCTETDEDHNDTLTLMESTEYDFAYMFKYSERPGTKAARKYHDDIPEEIKTKRLNEIISLQNKLSARSKKQDVGRIFEVLIEDFSKRSQKNLSGRTSQNKVAVFPGKDHIKGEYIRVMIEDYTPATLLGKIV